MASWTAVEPDGAISGQRESGILSRPPLVLLASVTPHRAPDGVTTAFPGTGNAIDPGQCREKGARGLRCPFTGLPLVATVAKVTCVAGGRTG
jgi:hypothetical protein